MKPKFYAGLVVFCGDGSYGKLVYPHQARPLQCEKGSPLFGDGDNAYVKGAKEPWYHRSELRPLTAREAGPARSSPKGKRCG